jgi:hypothetical protein
MRTANPDPTRPRFPYAPGWVPIAAAIAADPDAPAPIRADARRVAARDGRGMTNRFARFAIAVPGAFVRVAHRDGCACRGCPGGYAIVPAPDAAGHAAAIGGTVAP